jgi:hypothetical protein
VVDKDRNEGQTLEQSIEKCPKYLVEYGKAGNPSLHRRRNSLGPIKEEALLACLRLVVTFCLDTYTFIMLFVSGLKPSVICFLKENLTEPLLTRNIQMEDGSTTSHNNW